MAYSSIVKPSVYFNTKLTTGTGNSQAVTGVGFQPDWIWGKRRDSSGNHSLFDAVRGITKGLESNDTGAEFTSTDYYSSFDSDGFTIAAGSGGAGNSSGQTAVQWCWKANGQGSSNTDGSINTTYTSVNTTAGFSIVSYTGNGTAGATVGHGLGAVPKMIIVKKLSGVSTWNVYHQAIGNGKGLYLNTTDAEGASTGFWNNTSPTSSVFSVGADNTTNSATYIAYCFRDVTGYSKFGSFTGNASADGTFVYTGFKPAFLMIKRATGGTGNWHLFDSKRLGYNVNNYGVQPNLSSAENTANDLDLLSNGFKNRQSGNDLNGSNTYIYMAFAEEPLVANSGTDGVPATAR
jgi:hypothetical protein